MAVFCLVMVVLIGQAYRLHDETKSGMELQEAVELVRHDEDDRTDQLEQEVAERTGLLFSMDGTEFLRKVAALKQLEERYESQVQAGDAP